MEQFCFGIDVGGTTIKIGLFHTDETLMKKWEIRTNKEDNGAHILQDISDAMKAEMEARGILPEQIRGVGIGLPGPVLPNGVVNHCVNLGWGMVPVETELSELFYNRPVKAGNDGNVAALGEAWFGSGKGYDDMVMLTLGTGLGGGVILGRRIVTGSHGAAAEVGHMPLYPKATKPCNCGKTGCLEQIASATGIVNHTRELLETTEIPSSLRGKENISAKAILDACQAADPLAEQVVEDFTDALGRGMAVIASVCDPQIFVIGGGVSKTGSWLMERLKKSYDKYVFFASRDALVVPASLGNDGGMFGAAALILS